jgi:hypothetical protein
MAETNVVIDKVRAAVAAAQVKLAAKDPDFFLSGETLHFDHGHMVEITGKLARKNLSKNKYPLVILVEDIDHESYSGMLHCELRLFIVNLNPKVNDDSPQRWEGIFKPRLLPIYEELMRQLSSRFSWDKVNFPGNTPPHVWTARPKFGVWLREQNGTVKNILNDSLDAIEIKDLKVNTKALICV